METIKTLYAILNYECNLKCSFCDLHKKHIDFVEEKFLKSINDFEGIVILFGGEPTLFKDRYLKIVKNKKISSITTNLIDIDNDILESFRDISIATSWTPERFENKNEEDKWFKNLQKARFFCDNIRLLITISKGTLNINPQEMIKKIQLFDKYIDDVLFEFLVDDKESEEYFKIADKWITEVSNLWNKNINANNTIIQQVKNGWNFDCSNVYTLLPNGIIKHGCPQYTKHNILDKCFNCEKCYHCRPCILQNKCSYPHMLAESILSKKD